jgi:hypothetical protein
MLRPVPAAGLALIAALALGACDRQPSSAAPAPSTAPPVATSPAPAPAESAGIAAKPATGPGFQGIDAARFGMTGDQVRQAWQGALDGAAPASPGDCHLLTPASAKSPRDVSLMIEGDKFVRYDIGTADQAAPGGGKVGMTVDQVRALYAGRIREQPAKYVPGAVDLRISADDDSGSALVFETDAEGKVTRWRVGQPPAVDYVEGCS